MHIRDVLIVLVVGAVVAASVYVTYSVAGCRARHEATCQLVRAHSNIIRSASCMEVM